MKKLRISHHNHVRQVVPLFTKDEKTGIKARVGEKVIFHQKKFSQPLYQERQSMWRELNTVPKINSLRQQKLHKLQEEPADA